MKIYLTRAYSLRGIHELACEPVLHGHDYRLEVTVTGELNSESGWILSRDQMDKIVKTAIIQPFDKRRWTDLTWSTAGEVLTIFFKDILKKTELSPYIVGVSLQETSKNRFPL